MINRALGIPNSRRVDRQHGSSPSPNLIICPDLAHFVGCFQSNLWIHRWCVGKDALEHDKAAWVAGQRCVVPPGTVEALVYGVKTIDLGQGGEVLRNLGPFERDGLAKTGFPFEGHGETVVPVCELFD